MRWPDTKSIAVLWPSIRIAIAVIVALAIGYTVWKLTGQLHQQAFDFSQIVYGWWLLAIVTTIGAMTLSGLYWHRVLLSFGQQPALKDSLAAFFISQLGKYVPGKAMVVVMRTDAICGQNVRAAPAAVSVLVETLTWIGTGSAIGSFLLLVGYENRLLQGIAAVMAVASGLITTPWSLRKLATIAAKLKKRPTGTFLSGFGGTTVVWGWLVLSCGWLLNALGLWMVVRGIVGTEATLADFPLTLACITLATSAGFVSLLPGGLGVRELVLIPLLTTRFDYTVAVVAAIAIRVVWLSAELIMSGLMVGMRKFSVNRSSGKMD